MSYICKICGKPIGIKLAMGKGRTTTSCPNYDKMPPCDKSEDGKHKVKKTAGELPYEYLYNLFEFCADDVNETVFWFNSDSKRMERYLGYLPSDEGEDDKVYWAGYCDIEDGFRCSTATELFEAKIYDGKSIKDRWGDIHICEIGGIGLYDWFEYYEGYSYED